jgi:hypothetical protein
MGGAFSNAFSRFNFVFWKRIRFRKSGLDLVVNPNLILRPRIPRRNFSAICDVGICGQSQQQNGAESKQSFQLPAVSRSVGH